MNDEETLLTAEDVARIMRVSIRTVRRWVDSGEIEVVKIGRLDYRITREDLNKFIASRKERKQPKRSKTSQEEDEVK